MKQLVTTGIVLSRTDYGEADRIITLLTPDHGKLRLMARGVRRVKSKLAGGIELFSVSDITFIAGRGEIGTLISSRLQKHYGHIVKHIDRVQLGYELIKLLNKATEDHPEPAYFELLQQSFEALDDSTVSTELISAWFEAQLLRLGGHTPNLRSTADDQSLDASQTYNFDLDSMCFAEHTQGNFTAAHIKTLRLLFGEHPALALGKVQGIDQTLLTLRPLLNAMRVNHLQATSH